MSRTAMRLSLPSLLVLVLVLVLVIAGGAWVWLRSGGAQPNGTSEAEANAAADPRYDGSMDGGGTVAGDPVDGGGDQDEHDGETTPVPSAAPPTPAATPSAAPRAVDVSPTYSGWDRPTAGVVVGGVVSGVIEGGGTCTATLTRNGVSAEGSSDGVPDARTTSCGEIRVPGDRLSSGEWSATLTYRSPTSAGESATFTVVVP
ncbi:hypothetical protein ACI8AG_10920 [Blastococcus sp. SYSU DS0552]